MRKIKEVLRLHYELGLGQRQIARCCSISQSTVHGYLKRAESAGLSWPLLPDCDEAQLQERLFGDVWRGHRVSAVPNPTRLDSRATAKAQACHLAVAVGRVHRG